MAILLNQLPNALSLARLVLAPVVYGLIVNGHPWAWWVFFFGAISDAADGWLARRLHLESSVGVYLDPLADKVFVTAATVAWAMAGRLPLWLLALILGRDFMILAGSGLLYWAKGRTDFAPTRWGKISTIFQMAALGACFWFRDEWLNVFLGLTALGTAVSLVDYARLGVRKWQGR